MTQEEKKYPPAYFKSITLENVKCFKGKQTIDLSIDGKKPAQWTVILGNNGTGKTTLLEALVSLEPRESSHPRQEFNKVMVDPVGPSDTRLNSSSGNSDYFGSQFRISAEIFQEKKLSESANQSRKWRGYSATNIDNRGFVQKPFSDENTDKSLLSLQIIAYGASRKPGDINLASEGNGNGKRDRHTSLLSDAPLYNPEEWLMQTDYADKNRSKTAGAMLERIKKILLDILPDVKGHGFSFKTTPENRNYVAFETEYGEFPFRQLSYGYQTMTAWVIDLARRMFERYPDSQTPLAEPAVVLVDEIDLHLHPKWQREIIGYLSKHFPETQFIVTSHSPLIVQSADEVNLVLLQKEGDHVVIKQPGYRTLTGWSVEEILSELMGMDNEINSDEYLNLMQQFDEALNTDNYKLAKCAYDELDKILSPWSEQRKLLRIQMSSLMPDVA